MTSLLRQVLTKRLMGNPGFAQYHHKRVLRELLTTTTRSPPTSVHIPERRRVSFYADEGPELMDKPPASSVATYNPRSYSGFTDPFEGLISVKTRAQIEAEEAQAWEELKSRATSNVWRPRHRAQSPGPKLEKTPSHMMTPADILLEALEITPTFKTDEELALEQLSFAPLDVRNLPGLN